MEEIYCESCGEEIPFTHARMIVYKDGKYLNYCLGCEDKTENKEE